ncbi:glycosyltransferase family 4 protein [Thermaurantimonas aggregans]|uniref:glycosyltransferase family 4 protein n=1 Tax=Thermaurantimonas aggregans TaxID=2173829 RepID=UPI0023EFE4A3|nr:glycosyltransferase family 4 protein [Thermaurantimonas aggregans]MCX8148582.1 glycosyltransferase family 4 protein [Thermaurantimonas aggregans]
MKPLNILIFVGKFPQLSESFIIRKVYGLANNGYNVKVLSRRKGDLKILKSFGPLPKNVKIDWAIPDYDFYNFQTILKTLYYFIFFPKKTLYIIKNVYNLSKSYSIRNWIKYLSFIDKKNFEIIHFEFLGFASTYEMIFHLFPEKKIFISCRGADIHLLDLKDKEYKQKVIKFLHKVHFIHVVSNEIKNILVEKYISEDKKIFINRPAIALNKNDIDIQKVQRSEYLRLVAVGRLEWKKGFDYLLAALHILKNKDIKFYLEIIGDGSLKAELLFSISDLGLENNVKLCGALPNSEVIKKLYQADIFILSSCEEGISNAVLEAMALKKAVISTNVGGMNEVIQSGKNGILVPPRNPKSLADSIEYLISNPDIRERLGIEASKTIERDFTIDRQINIFDKYYKIALND